MTITAAAHAYIKICPNCQSGRAEGELYCEAVLPSGSTCGWPLIEVEPVAPGRNDTAAGASSPGVLAARRCTNGHPLSPGDELCLACGADPEPLERTPDPPVETGDEITGPTQFNNWIAERRLAPTAPAEPWQRYIVSRPGHPRQALLTLYNRGFEPDPAVHEALRRMPLDHIPELLDTGRHEERAFDVVELIQGGSLAEAGWFAAQDPAILRRVIDELGRALASFAEAGLRHRDLRPASILLRTREPLDLVITGFGSARLSDFDLEAVAPLELTRYSAPEAIVGAVSAASDWWSLGMLVLEQATAGRCFAGINDQAFYLHVVTRGVSVPDTLDPELRTLLRGLLARDPLRRWAANDVQAWLRGDPGVTPEDPEQRPVDTGPSITLAGHAHTRPDTFALAAAEAVNWAEARELTLRGSVATWLAERSADPRMLAEVRRLTTDESLPDDMRHALALMAMNPALPLTVEGAIVTPAWLLLHPEAGYAIVTGETTRHLERLGREPTLVRLRSRAIAVRERAQQLEIVLDEERARIALLATSRANLDAERAVLRGLYPDTEHPGLAALMERARLPDEDVIILVSAAVFQFVPLATLSGAAQTTASAAGVSLAPAELNALLVMPRRQIFERVEERIANFARCGNSRVDEWADAFRVERRMPLDRAATLLAVPSAAWQEPPRQQYVATLLELFEKRVAGAIGRGPLVRFILGKTTPRLDLIELGTALKPAEALLNHVLTRVELTTDLDPAAYIEDPTREGRLRRLVSHAQTFQRDTGIDGRYLGFPFLLARDSRAAEGTKPRLAPVLLWPVAVDIQSGAARTATLMFDRDRDEIRLNPALEVILGPEAFARWRTGRDDLLARANFRASDVMDVFGTLARPRGRTLAPLPGKDVRVAAGALELVPSAALFNAEFTGQAVAEDLRQMRRRPPAGTALDAALRVTNAPPETGAAAPVPEQERYTTVASDPSQDNAVLRARQAPGLLVEGPPGTGKSQTIVNMIADAIGRGETVLVVCQKIAALRVVEKRLQAEGLGDRLFFVKDINKDRAAILNALREQVPAARTAPAGRAASVRRARADKAGRIEALEQQIDRHHAALHVLDDLTGLSYRDLVGELIGVEAAGATLSTPLLRPVVGRLGRSALARLEEGTAPLIRLWLDADFEGSPLDALLSFNVDDAVAQQLYTDFAGFIASERTRQTVIAKGPLPFVLDDPAPHAAWLETHGATFAAMPDAQRADLAAWLDVFLPIPGATPAGTAALADLEHAQTALSALDKDAHTDSMFAGLAALSPAELRMRRDEAAVAIAPATSFWARLSFTRRKCRSRMRAVLTSFGEPADDPHMQRLHQALQLEAGLRPVREILGRVQATLGRPQDAAPASVHDAHRAVARLHAELEPIARAAGAVVVCPRPAEAAAMARAATRDAVDALRATYELAFDHHAARAGSRVALIRLASWFKAEWIKANEERIASNTLAFELLGALVSRFGTLAPFQRFRSRAATLDADVLRVLAVLRPHADALKAVPAIEREAVVQRTLRREALLAWKSRIETNLADLNLEREEIERKVAALANLDREMHGENRKLLMADIDGARLGNQTAWDAITRISGPRALRLREVLDQGVDLGLMRLRPVWLVNPDVASRMLPLKAGMFDVVIFDEASQMPVEFAAPSLFRAKRCVISGDEKQMPPSSFFASRVDGDDDNDTDLEGLEDATEAERAAQADAWNKRDVQSCPDVLQLARSVLPSEMLQIHYRSKYRELIGYSNVAFYKNGLNVPARHPDDEIRKVRPIEVIRVDGVYTDQTNAAEAAKIVEILRQFWSAAPEDRPSIGVVTFNRKQVDLVEEAIENCAKEDPEFLRALQKERERTQNGEDMGFFVKNVENVQGDERDVIIFSTTFGRDAHGTFRRLFGVLGQAGGERRLNVAVTRARTKVIVVTSIPLKDVSDWLTAGRAAHGPRDFLQAYLDYAAKVSGGDLDGVRTSAARFGRQSQNMWDEGGIEDGFTASVATFIRNLGYRPVAGNDSDAFRLDFAIENPATGLFGIGIECDAPQHPLLAKARAREIWRASVLKKSVPHVHRVSSIAWYSRGDEERARLRAAIEAAVGEGTRS